MVAPSAFISRVHLLNSNTSSTSKLRDFDFTQSRTSGGERSLSRHHRFLCGSYSQNCYLHFVSFCASLLFLRFVYLL